MEEMTKDTKAVQYSRASGSEPKNKFIVAESVRA